jgi:hypothetical protein
MSNSGNASLGLAPTTVEIDALRKLERNANRYSRAAYVNPHAFEALNSTAKQYANLKKTQRQRNIQRSISPGTVQKLIEQLNTGSPKSNRNSPVAFQGGRRRKSRRGRSRKHKRSTRRR